MKDIIYTNDIKREFYVKIPKRLFEANRKFNPTKITLKRIKDTGEYVFVPSRNIFNPYFLTIDELKMITKELETLNKK